MNPLRVILADDHELVRTGIRALLTSLSGVEVIGEADNGREALRLIEKYSPDVVLMDIQMLELNGLEVLAQAKKDFPHVKIIILSMHANEEYVIRAHRAHADGYLLKDAPLSELELALRYVQRGEKYFSPPILRSVVSYQERRGREGEAKDVLTPRQREIMQLIAEGNSTKEIAQKLGLSPKTVETHRAQLFARLEIHDVLGLVREAIRRGIVAPL